MNRAAVLPRRVFAVAGASSSSSSNTGGGPNARKGAVADDLAGDWDKKERMGELGGEVGMRGETKVLGV